MAAVKTSGLGDNFYIGGYDLSGDVGSLGTISGGNAPLEVTAIDKSAIERIGGQRNGTIEFSTFFDDQAGQEHPILSTLPRTDTQCMYFRGTTIGNQAAAMTAKQVNYDFTRAADGSLTTAVQAQSNGYGLEWGQMLTAGVTVGAGSAITLTAIDTGGSLSFGAQAYLQVFAFSGTDLQFKVQDSADNSSFSTIAALTWVSFGASAPYVERLATSNTATIRRYVRLAATTSGGYSSVSAAAMVVKNAIAGQVF